MNAIEQAIQKWAQSTQGQKALQRAATEAYKAGYYGGKGDGTTEAREPEFYANELIEWLRAAMCDADWPNGMPDGFDDWWVADVGSWDDSVNAYRITIRYNEAYISRPSLYPEGYPKGAYNIVALLNRGYYPHRGYSEDGANRVYGEWHGRMTFSLPERPGLWYIQQGVESFLKLYGTVAKVDIDSIYGGGPYV